MDVGVGAEARKLAKRGTLTKQSFSIGPSSGTWYSFLSVTGAGNLLSFAAHCPGWSLSGNVPVRITVDGGTPYTLSSSFAFAPRAYDAAGVSSVASTLLLTPIRFSTSLLIECQQNSGSAQTIYATGYLVL